MSHITLAPRTLCISVSSNVGKSIVHAFEVRNPVLNEGVIVLKEPIAVLVITIKSKVRGSLC